MAARKTRQPPAAQSPAAQSASLSETQPDPPVTSTQEAAPAPRRLWLLPAVLLLAVWLVFLVTLARRTANPVTLNLAQIRHADLVVEATVEKLATGECRIVRAWPEAPQLGPVITVAGLTELTVRPGEAYLLPLQRNERGNGFRIAPTPPALANPLIYPASHEARRQLEQILSEPAAGGPNAGNPAGDE